MIYLHVEMNFICILDIITICREIGNYIDSFIDDFQEMQPSLSYSKEKYSIIRKYLETFQIKTLSLYYSDFKDDELYKMCKVLGMDIV